MDFDAARDVVRRRLNDLYAGEREHPAVLPYGFDTGGSWAPMVDWRGVTGVYVYLVDKQSGGLTPVSFPEFVDLPDPSRAGEWPNAGPAAAVGVAVRCWQGRMADDVAGTRAMVGRAQVLLAQTYHRDADGQFASGNGGGAADGSDGEGEGGSLDEGEGEYGYGTAPDGSSYSEFDVDEAGNPRFSSEYRAKYGPINSDSAIGAGLTFVAPEKGKLHIADDALGAKQRQVVQEFTNAEARDLADGIYSVYSGESASVATKSGVKVAPAGPHPTQDGVNVTWSNGRRSTFDGEAGNDEAFELQESLLNASGT